MFTRLRSAFQTGRESNAELASARNLEVRGFAQTHAGAVRRMNEDCVAIHIPSPYDPDQFSLAVVADGMGGANAGEVASELASRLIPRLFLESSGNPQRSLERAIQSAGREIYEQARRNPELRGMGTTCVVLVLKPPRAWVAWVGDSRAYLIRDGKLTQLTEDHSVVQALVRKGLLTKEEAARHADRNIVTRSLGVHKSVDVGEREPLVLQPGDSFLLCSDGLTDVLTAQDLMAAVESVPVDIASKSLVSEANRRGASDNVSAVVLSVSKAVSEHSDLAETREFTLPRKLRETL